MKQLTCINILSIVPSMLRRVLPVVFMSTIVGANIMLANSALADKAIGENTEQLLTNASATKILSSQYRQNKAGSHKPITQASMCNIQPVCQALSFDKQRISMLNTVEPIYFDSDKAVIKPEAITQLKKWLAYLEGQNNIHLHFVGYTDNQPLNQSHSQYYVDHEGLSIARAEAVMKLVANDLDTAHISITSEGRGATNPVGDNTTARGRAMNHRVEVVVSHSAFTTNTESAIAYCADQHQPSIPAVPTSGLTPWRVSIDGQPMVSTHNLHTAITQRCNDVALEKAKIQIQYDNLKATPALNVGAWPLLVKPQGLVSFAGWSNYPYWIDKAEVLVYQKGLVSKKLVARVLLNKDMQADWQVPNNISTSTLYYRLRVYDQKWRYDQTARKTIAISKDNEYADTLSSNEKDKRNELLAVYGNNTLVRQKIPVNGGTITVNGLDIPEAKNVWVMDQLIPVDANGRFVSQHILPSGLQTAEVAVVDNAGNGELFWRDIRFKDDDWFYVGIADVTLAKNNTSGAIDLVRGEVVDRTSTYGRFAFYAKGKLNDRYKATVRVDTGEEPFDELFKNIHKKDPRSLFRRLANEDGFATFGDDSTTVDDTPTQGKFYAKIEDKNAHALWGNFSVDLSENELAPINRGLYGLEFKYQSDQQITSLGSSNEKGNSEAHSASEHTTKLTLFAADPGTVPAHDEFLGTGGSLYYLRHRDITQGSEQLRIDIRDKDSNFVLASIPLSAGQDYELDELQGTVLLSKPLSTFATSISQGDLVRSSSYAGQPAYLIVDYEYVPGFDNVDTIAIGGRASHWFNQHFNVGITASDQEEDGTGQTLGAVDITLKKSSDTWLKLSSAKSKGVGVGEQQSNDGGFDFNDGVLTQQDDEADANRVEARIDGKDLGVKTPLATTIYWQNREEGYSGLGQQASADIEQSGVNIVAQLSSKTDLAINYAEADQDQGEQKQATEIDMAYQVSEGLKISAGVRNEDKQSPTETLGERTDMIAKVDYQITPHLGAYVFVQDTLSKDEQRTDNDRVGIGSQYQVSDRVSILGEVSDGELGEGALVGLNYQSSDSTSFYMNYALDADEERRGVNNSKGTAIVGAKTRFSDSLSVYAEEKYTHGDQPEGLAQAYGVELSLDERWTYGVSMEAGELESESNDVTERQAIGMQLGYSHEKTIYAGSVEFRNDKSATEDRDSWLWRNTYKRQTRPDWRFIGRADIAFSDSQNGELFDGEFAEVALGYAYRPVGYSRWNNLFSYTYLFDKTSPDQLTSTDLSVDFQQRSHVLAMDINYDINRHWEIGGKYAFRRSEIRTRDDDSEWFRSDASLYVLRADWHVTHRWDLLAEARLLDLKEAQDQRAGMLFGIYRHFGDHFKLGVGYNYTDFTDDLTDLDYDARGFFINAIGKF